MIYCMIDGKKAYPSTSNNIKITRENPYLKKMDSYTYDITFPLDVMANRIIFGAVNRIDVRKKVQKYKVCRLYAANKCVISGTGIVTSTDSDNVKLQIVAGVSELKYNSRADKIYIDTINAYPDADSLMKSMGIGSISIKNDLIKDEDFDAQYGKMLNVTDLLNNGSQTIGDVSKFVFSAIHDQTNDLCCNALTYIKTENKTLIGVSRPCIQPNLMMVLKCVLEYMGYKFTSNRYDTYPWNRIVIANAHVTNKIKNALPHWTAAKFLDEFCNFFNASVVINEITKTVRIVANNETNTKDVVEYECEDEFTTEYDEDGVEYIGTSNLKFDRDSENYDIIPEDVFKEFDYKDYPSRSEMWDAIKAMTLQERLQTLFHCPTGFYYVTWPDEDDGPTLENTAIQQCGQFSELVRDKDSDNAIELEIVPAAVADDQDKQFLLGKSAFEITFVQLGWIQLLNRIPTVDNNHDETKGNDIDYVTVKDAITNGDSKESTENNEVMPVMFIPKFISRQTDITIQDKVRGASLPSLPDDGLYVFRGYCDSAISYYYGKWGGNVEDDHEANSMSINVISNFKHSLGTFHVEDNVIKTKIESRNQIVIKFLCDGMPDPKKVYRFRNKLFLCSKIEITVKNDGIEKEKTGYFYEI